MSRKVALAPPRRHTGAAFAAEPVCAAHAAAAMLRGLGRQVSQRFVAASAGRSAGDLFGLRSFLRRLCAAFGWKYVAILASEYGVNQGTGLRLAGAARSYYLLDSVGMSSADYGHLSGFSHIPWQLKSLFGLLSDTVPLGGLHRAPYMLIAGVLGLFALGMLTALPAATGILEILLALFATSATAGLPLPDAYMAPPPCRSRRLALKHVSIDDLPPHALQHILLTATTHDNLLRFVAACARVCGEWWR